MPMSVYGTGGAPRKVSKFGVYNASGLLKAVKAAWVYDAAGVARKFFSSSGGRREWEMNPSTSGSSTGYRYFSYGSLTPELPQVRDSGVVLEISTDGSQLKLEIGGIGGAMVTRDNVFTNFHTDLIPDMLSTGANFVASGSAGNSSGVWTWPTATKFDASDFYNQWLDLV